MKNYDAIIINYNGQEIISRCLESLYASSMPPASIIIYDNASRDKSVEIIKKKFPKVVLIKGEKNLGFGRANNEAMRHSDSEFILFMNNDVILDKNCTRELLEGFKDNKIAVVNPIVYKGWDKSASPEVYSFGAEMNSSGFGYSLYDCKIDRTDLTCFSGACFMARGDCIKKVKFEKSFFMYYEEPYLSAHILSEGGKIGRIVSAKCSHLENYSSPQERSKGICFRQFYAIQNRAFLLGRFWTTRLLIKALPLNLAHLFYNVYFFIKSGDWCKTKLLFLFWSSLCRGRREFVRPNNPEWISLLPDPRLSNLISLKKKVYK
jgi:GT2 family glycosyltransferase